MTPTLPERFMSKVRIDPDTGCWMWIGATGSDGLYGRFRVGKRKVPAHRWAYEQVVGTIPEGLVADHICNRSLCANPDHIQPTTQRINTTRSRISIAGINSRKTECIHGHPFDSINTGFRRTGQRFCKQCHREQKRKKG